MNATCRGRVESWRPSVGRPQWRAAGAMRAVATKSVATVRTCADEELVDGECIA